MPASTGVRRAKYDTDCAVCPRRLRRGQPMLPSYANMRDGLGVSRWAHVECIAQAERRRQAKADAADAAARRHEELVAALSRAQQAVEAQLGWPLDRAVQDPAPTEVGPQVQDSVTLITYFERTGCLRCPDDLRGPQLSQWLRRQAGLISAAMRRHSRLTFPRLEAAVRYCVEKRLVVDLPGAVLPQLALRLPVDTTSAPAQQPDPIGQVLTMLLSLEMASAERDDEDDWLGRLVRCSGTGRRYVIEQYIASDHVNPDVKEAVVGVLALTA